MRISTVFATIALAAASLPASAATLLTSASGYTGPVLVLSAFPACYTLTAGPVSLPGGITYSSDGNSAIGKGGSSCFYGINDNGESKERLIIGTDSPTATVTLSFATPVSQFGGGFNYSLINGLPGGANPVISAFDVSNNLIASYDLFSLAPISTPGGLDEFRFRGIDGGGTGIASFTFSGAFIVIAGVPEPASWALLITGFGLVGAAMRRRRAADAFA